MAPILEMRSFDFSSLPVSGSASVVLCPALCVLAYTRVRLSVRVHALTMSPEQLLGLIVWHTLPCDEDPLLEFDDPTPVTFAAFTAATAAPSLVTGVGHNPAAYVKVTLLAMQARLSALPLRATLSANLLLRPG